MAPCERFSFKLILFILCASISSEAKNRFLHYKPEVIQLKGTIETQTFPGPPNYESIKNGDKIESVWILRVDEPFDMITTSQDKDIEAAPEKNIKFVHLAIFNDSIWPKLADGKHVLVKGSLYHRENGHHHSRVLLETHSLEEVK